VVVKLLLDTNAYAALMRGHNGLVDLIRGAEQVFISTVVIGELLFGFEHGTRQTQNSAQLQQFVANHYVKVLPVTWSTATRYGRIATSLRQKRLPIPSNDIWIAAHAFESGADLVSFDQHFARVDGLSWVIPPS
jgi:tRNA(fMet)-specific endonuclease VapC